MGYEQYLWVAWALWDSQGKLLRLGVYPTRSAAAAECNRVMGPGCVCIAGAAPYASLGVLPRRPPPELARQLRAGRFTRRTPVFLPIDWKAP